MRVRVVEWLPYTDSYVKKFRLCGPLYGVIRTAVEPHLYTVSQDEGTTRQTDAAQDIRPGAARQSKPPHTRKLRYLVVITPLWNNFDLCWKIE